MAHAFSSSKETWPLPSASAAENFFNESLAAASEQRQEGVRSQGSQLHEKILQYMHGESGCKMVHLQQLQSLVKQE